MSHPHPDKLHVRRQYRRHIMASKKKWGTARSLIHYRQIVEAYLWSKT
jgi:hypothetical protein